MELRETKWVSDFQICGTSFGRNVTRSNVILSEAKLAVSVGEGDLCIFAAAHHERRLSRSLPDAMCALRPPDH